MSDKKIKILLAEDESDLRALIADALEKLDYEIHQAADGEQALLLVDQVHPDVIVSDIVMPKKSGNDFLKELRKLKHGKEIPFIVLTARINMRDYFEVVKVDGFLEKPFKIDELVDQIHKVIHSSRDEGSKSKVSTGQAEQKMLSKDDIAITSTAEGILDVEMIDAVDEIIVREVKTKEVRKALLAEDDVRVYNKIEKILFENDYLVRVVSTPSKCLENAVEYLPDVIFLKDVLSGMTAVKIIDLLRGMSRARDISVVVYGGNELEQIKKELLGKKYVSVLISSGETELWENIKNHSKRMFKKCQKKDHIND